MMHAKPTEPSAWARPPLFMIGQDDRGNWVVQDLAGICGGLFVTREAALRYIRDETGHQPQAVVMVSGVLDLDMARKPTIERRQERAGAPVRLRHIA